MNSHHMRRPEASLQHFRNIGFDDDVHTKARLTEYPPVKQSLIEGFSEYDESKWPKKSSEFGLGFRFEDRCPKGEISEKFCLDTEDDIVDLHFWVKQTEVRQRIVHLYLCWELERRAWEKYGGPTGLQAARNRLHGRALDYMNQKEYVYEEAGLYSFDGDVEGGYVKEEVDEEKVYFEKDDCDDKEDEQHGECDTKEEQDVKRVKDEEEEEVKQVREVEGEVVKLVKEEEEEEDVKEEAALKELKDEEKDGGPEPGADTQEELVQTRISTMQRWFFEFTPAQQADFLRGIVMVQPEQLVTPSTPKKVAPAANFLPSPPLSGMKHKRSRSLEEELNFGWI